MKNFILLIVFTLAMCTGLKAEPTDPVTKKNVSELFLPCITDQVNVVSFNYLLSPSFAVNVFASVDVGATVYLVKDDAIKVNSYTYLNYATLAPTVPVAKVVKSKRELKQERLCSSDLFYKNPDSNHRKLLKRIRLL